MPFRRFPDPSPVPVEAVFSVSSVVVTFDRALEEGPLATANWTVRFENARYPVASAAAAGIEVTLMLSSALLDPGPPGVSYAASPADVIGADGVAAEAFVDFPLE